MGLEDDHAEMVMQLAKPGNDILDSMSAEDAHCLHMAVGISSESGELLDAIKKAVIYRQEYDMENIIEELGDLEYHMSGLRSALGITREECLHYNKKKLRERYGEKYSDQAAAERRDKVS